MLTELTETATRLAGKPPSTKVEVVLHPGGRGERGFVTFFLYDRGEAFCLAKVPRVDSSLTQNEADNLGLVADALATSPLRTKVDQALGTAEIAGRLVLFKKLIPGGPSSQLIDKTKPDDVLLVLRSTTEWLLKFIADTAAHQSADTDTKRAIAERIVARDGDRSWVETFMGTTSQTVGPSHGDLVPANVLFDGGRVSGVVDFENYSSLGLPYADFVGVLVSVATTAYGRDSEMLDTTFRSKTEFSRGVAAAAGAYCAQTGISIDEFIDLLPMYSDRALTIASEWKMRDEHNFHTRLRDLFVSEKDLLKQTLG